MCDGIERNVESGSDCRGDMDSWCIVSCFEVVDIADADVTGRGELALGNTEANTSLCHTGVG